VTEKQGQYLAFIKHYMKIHGQAPAESDMQAYFGVTPPSVHQMVMTLEQKGFIRRTPGSARSIVIRIPEEGIPDLKGAANERGRSRGPSKVTAATPVVNPWPNIDWLVDGEGDITIGPVGGLRCVAAAADSDMALAMLVRRRGESLSALLLRLDEAIRLAIEEDIITDEVNT
jgi:DNA-binding MarR family transcriptional regulator